MVQSMTAAAAVPHFHFCDEVEMADLKELKEELESSFLQRYDVKLTYLPFLVKVGYSTRRIGFHGHDTQMRRSSSFEGSC